MAPPTVFNFFRSSHRRPGSNGSSPQSQSRRPPPSSSHPLSSSLSAPSPPASSSAARAESPISPAPPVLPPIPRVASKKDDSGGRKRSVDRTPPSISRPASGKGTSSNERRLSDTAGSIPPHRETLLPRRPSSQQPNASPPSAWKAPFSPVLADAPFLPPIQRVTSDYERERPSLLVQQQPSVHPREPTFTLDPPRTPDGPAASEPITKMTRAYTSFADFGRLDLRRTSKLSTDASQSSPSPSTNSRTHSHDPPLLHHTSQHASSPSSSMSSFVKSASQTNLAVESSPGSSRPPPLQHSPTNLTTSAPAPRISRARNLLNPVSLLMRRRASQGIDDSDVPTAPQRMFEVPAMDVPEGYDPRIKGKRVHDFDDESRKPRRNYSTNDMMGMARQSAEHPRGHGRRSSIPALGANVTGSLGGAPGTEKEHTPVFVENFDEDHPEQDEDTAKAIQHESLANQDFLKRASRHLDFDALDFSTTPPATGHRASLEPTPHTPPSRSSVAAPSTAIRVSGEPQTAMRNSQERQHVLPQTSITAQATPARTSKNTDVSSVRMSSEQSTARSSISHETGNTTPPQHSPFRDETRQSTSLDAPFQPTTPLKHLASDASRVSRFSFQLNSDRSVEQEKALEDKHKAKYAANAAKHISTADSRFDELQDEDYDYDAMDDGGYEEDIPEIGAYDDDLSGSVGLGNARWSTLDPQPLAQPSSSGMTRDSSQSHYTTRSPTEATASEPQSAVEMPAPLQPHQPPVRSMTRSTVISDDMYYDDGVIGPQTIAGKSELEHSGDNEQDAESESASPHWSHTRQLSSETVQPSNDNATDFHAKGKNDDYDEAMRESTLRHSSSLQAYHGALASAASRAAKDGRFSRGPSTTTASSRYSEEVEENLQLGEDDNVFGEQQPFEDIDEEEDPMIAAANAEVLASEDADFYGREFGFYGQITGASDGQMHNGGYFGQANLLRATLNAQNEPNLTPITERSEYSTRNSFIGSTPWGPPSSMSHQSYAMSPGLKDIAASIGMDDSDMTLGQLLRLRRAAFEGNGSSPRSVQGSSGSNDSSPTSAQNNSSPLAFKHSSALQEHRRGSELELADVREAPEEHELDQEQEHDVAADSPISPTITIETARAVPLGARRPKDRRGSAEAFAQGYQDVVNGSPPNTELPVLPRSERRSSSPLSGAPTVAGRSSPPILASPALPKALAAPSALSTPWSASAPISDTPGAVPAPPQDMMQKFASRPGPDGYRKSWEPSHRASMSGASKGSEGPSGTSIAYVRDVGEDGQEQWYLERRRKRSSGDLVVLSREAVQGGRI